MKQLYLTPVTEPELIEACRRGESKAQQQLYTQFAGMMLGVCIRYVKNQMDAEEVLINGFMKVFQHIGNFEQKGSFEGWIRRIMVNEALMHLRKKEPMHLAIERDTLDISAPAQADTELQAEELLQMLNELPAGYRAVFNLYAIEGFSHKEIAEMLQISEGTSKSQLSKARAMLQRMLQGNQLSQVV